MDEFDKFLYTITQIEKTREFDRKVDRLKKSSSATTFWAVFGGILGIYGLAHFYLNRPLEGLVILLLGFISTFFISIFSFGWLLSITSFYPGYWNTNFFNLNSSDLILLWVVAGVIQLTFFIVNIVLARYQYTRYDWFIHLKAHKPWNNWGLNSKM